MFSRLLVFFLVSVHSQGAATEQSQFVASSQRLGQRPSGTLSVGKYAGFSNPVGPFLAEMKARIGWGVDRFSEEQGPMRVQPRQMVISY